MLGISAFLYFCWGMVRFGLVIDTDGWAILYASRLLLDGQIAGDPNKTFSLLVGMFTLICDELWVFPVVSSLLGAGTCLGVYRLLESLTGNRSIAFLGWAIILASPVLLWEVLSCNSISFMTCFLIWALYYLVSKDFFKGCLMLSLASLARPEPILIAVFLSCFMIWKIRSGELTRKSGVTFIIILGLPPLWWLGFNKLAYGQLFYSLERVHQGGQILITSFNPGSFLSHFWWFLKTYYTNIYASSFSLMAMVFLFAQRKKLFFLYSFFIISFLGLWIFTRLNFALIERFLLPSYIYLVIFSVLFLNTILEKLRARGTGMNLFRYGSVGILLLFFVFSFHAQPHSRIRSIILYHASFDRDLPAVVNFLEQKVAEGKSPTVLVSARRTPFLLFSLFNGPVSYVSYRKLYQEQSNLSRSEIDFVILAPNDFFSTQVKVYNFDLLTPKGLAKQGLKIVENTTISSNTNIFKILPEEKESL